MQGAVDCSPATAGGRVVLMLRPDQWRGRCRLIMRVEHAALYGGDLVELAGQQLARDGTPMGRVWLVARLHDLPAAAAAAAGV